MNQKCIFLQQSWICIENIRKPCLVVYSILCQIIVLCVELLRICLLIWVTHGFLVMPCPPPRTTTANSVLLQEQINRHLYCFTRTLKWIGPLINIKNSKHTYVTYLCEPMTDLFTDQPQSHPIRSYTFALIEHKSTQ